MLIAASCSIDVYSSEGNSNICIEDESSHYMPIEASDIGSNSILTGISTDFLLTEQGLMFTDINEMSP